MLHQLPWLGQGVQGDWWTEPRPLTNLCHEHHQNAHGRWRGARRFPSPEHVGFGLSWVKAA